MNASVSIPALTIEQQQKVINKTQVYIKQAVDLFHLKEKSVDIVFNLKGRAAGMYRIKNNKKILFSHWHREIRYNPFIFAKYFEDNVATTIPHEVGHYVTDMIYGLKNIKPHGKEWKAVMAAFGADASVTASYDLSGIPQRKQSRFIYLCDCREHQLSTIRHNKITKRHRQYFCHYCKQTLQFKQQAEPLR